MRRGWRILRGAIWATGLCALGLVGACRAILGIVPLDGGGAGGGGSTASGGSAAGGGGTSIPFWQLGGAGDQEGSGVALLENQVILAVDTTGSIDQGCSQLQGKFGASAGVFVASFDRTAGASTDCTWATPFVATGVGQLTDGLGTDPSTMSILLAGHYKNKDAAGDIGRCSSLCTVSQLPSQPAGVFLTQMDGTGNCVCTDVIGAVVEGAIANQRARVSVSPDVLVAFGALQQGTVSEPFWQCGALPVSSSATSFVLGTSPSSGGCSLSGNLNAPLPTEDALTLVALADGSVVASAMFLGNDIPADAANPSGCPAIPKGQGSYNSFVQKMTPSKGCTWRFGIATGGMGAVKSPIVRSLSDGTLIVMARHFGDFVTVGSCSIEGPTGSFLAVIDEKEGPSCGSPIGTNGSYSLEEVAPGKSRSFFLVGWFEGSVEILGQALTSTGARDAFVFKATVSVSGMPEYKWHKQFGGIGAADSATAASVAVDSEDNVYVTGSFRGKADFGNGLVQSKGGADAFLVRLGP